MTGDRFGLGWRDGIAPALWERLDRLDCVEVVADDWFGAGRRRLGALRTLGAQVPLLLHGVSLGAASAAPVDPRRLDALARVVEAARPEAWSEHLAFVRGGGIEIGHLAAPPRNAATVEGAARNLREARRVVGSAPAVENVATLVDPPGSDLPEGAWVAAVLGASGCPLLLDLHNLHANAANFGFSPREFLDRIPADRLGLVHVAGGSRVGGPGGERVLDDHLHPVPDPVYGLLEEVARRAPGPLTVILERDGRFPGVDALLAELDRAREAVARGRAAA
jgi:uncharacterized protein (UPF0276 family)